MPGLPRALDHASAARAGTIAVVREFEKIRRFPDAYPRGLRAGRRTRGPATRSARPQPACRCHLAGKPGRACPGPPHGRPLRRPPAPPVAAAARCDRGGGGRARPGAAAEELPGAQRGEKLSLARGRVATNMELVLGKPKRDAGGGKELVKELVKAPEPFLIIFGTYLDLVRLRRILQSKLFFIAFEQKFLKKTLPRLRRGHYFTRCFIHGPAF